jgi:hypothetical protein
MRERKRQPPNDAETVRRVEEARPDARATDPTFDAIIEAILDADADDVREHRRKRQKLKGRKTTE